MLLIQVLFKYFFALSTISTLGLSRLFFIQEGNESDIKWNSKKVTAVLNANHENRRLLFHKSLWD